MWPVANVLFPRKREREKEEGRVSEMYLHRDLHCSISTVFLSHPLLYLCFNYIQHRGLHLTRPRHQNKTY